MLLSLMAVVVLYACVCVYVYLAKQLWQRKLTVYDFCQPRAVQGAVAAKIIASQTHTHTHTHMQLTTRLWFPRVGAWCVSKGS